MIAVGGELTMAKLAASMGYWALDNSQVRLLAKHNAMEVDDNTSMLDCLLHMSKSTMGCDDADAMSYISKRLVRKAHKDYKSMQILADVDEAAACLDHTDEQVVKDEKEKGKAAKLDYTTFREEFRVKRKEVRAAGVAAPAKGKGRGKGGKAKAMPAKRKLPDKMEMMPQPVAKTYMPPGKCWIWQQRSSNSWATRYGHLPAISRSIQKYGETLALQIVISNCWNDYCLLFGLDIADCDIDGLVAVDTPDLD